MDSSIIFSDDDLVLKTSGIFLVSHDSRTAVDLIRVVMSSSHRQWNLLLFESTKHDRGLDCGASGKFEAWQPITVSLYFVTVLAICDSFPVGLLITPC